MLRALSSAPGGISRLDAEILLAHLLGVGRSALYARPEMPLPNPVPEALRALAARRAAGFPLAYLLGQREFWSLNLEVGPGVLVPRPETEHLVECALARIPANARWTVVDLGTGSGAIALALATERPDCHILAIDLSANALAMAARNRLRHVTRGVDLLRGRWCGALAPASVDLIVSNPPYIAATDPCLAEDGLCFEPREALAAGPEGLDAIRELTAEAPRVLRSGGHLLLEHGQAQGAAVRRLLECGGFTQVESVRDLAGHERITGATRKSSRSGTGATIA